MKADPFVQLRLLDLQALDSARDRLAHKRRTLPELAEIARLDGLLEGLGGQIALVEATVADLQRELDKAEADIEQVRARKTRDQDRLNSGAITVPKQLEELQHEVATLTQRQSVLEDAELEVMERMEQTQAELDALVAQRNDHQQARAAAVDAREVGWLEIDVETRAKAQERDEVVKEIPDDLLSLYEKLRAGSGGIGAAAIARGQCSGCRLDLMNNEKAQFRAAPVDAVLRHEECGRILVRTAESGL